MTKRAHSTVVYPTVKQYEALEADNADLIACLRDYMSGHQCKATGECPSQNKAKALLARLDGKGE